MKIYTEADYPQGSEKWWTLRRGIPTASNFDRIMTAAASEPRWQAFSELSEDVCGHRHKTEDAARKCARDDVWPSVGRCPVELSGAADDYICELIGDLHRLAPPMPEEGFSNFATRYGQQTEPEARSWYEMHTGNVVNRVGFVTTEDGRFGCSPDGLLDYIQPGFDLKEPGGLELKCPQPKTHVSYLLAGGLPSEYKGQVHGSLIVTGRAWWDFCSYCPGLKPLIVRVTPDEYTVALSKCLELFFVRLQERLKIIMEM